MARKDISNYKLTSSSHLKLKFTVHSSFFAYKPTPARVPSFISASNIRLKIANLMRKREKFDAISLSFKIPNGPLFNNANPRTFCLKSPRDWTRWLGPFPPRIGECHRQSGTTFSEGMDLCNTLPPLEQIWITNSWASMRPSLLWAK